MIKVYTQLIAIHLIIKFFSIYIYKNNGEFSKNENTFNLFNIFFNF